MLCQRKYGLLVTRITLIKHFTEVDNGGMYDWLLGVVWAQEEVCNVYIDLSSVQCVHRSVKCVVNSFIFPDKQTWLQAYSENHRLYLLPASPFISALTSFISKWASDTWGGAGSRGWVGGGGCVKVGNWFNIWQNSSRAPYQVRIIKLNDLYNTGRRYTTSNLPTR